MLLHMSNGKRFDLTNPTNMALVTGHNDSQQAFFGIKRLPILTIGKNNGLVRTEWIQLRDRVR